MVLRLGHPALNRTLIAERDRSVGSSLPPSTLICRPAIVLAAHKDGSVIGLHPGIGQIPRGYYPCGRRADQPDRCRPELGQAC